MKQPHITIGLAIICKNEEKELKGCIESCHGVDQVAVVDTGSTDATVSIAKELGCIVDDTTFKWPDPPDYKGLDFSAARNRSVELLDTDWFMFLDADERLDKGNMWTIRRKIEEGPKELEALLVTMYTEKGDVFWREKILKRLPKMKFVGRVHEGMSDETMYCSWTKDIRIHYKLKPITNRNYTILREEILEGENINNMRLQYLMGREEFCWGNIPSAITFLERYVRTYQQSGKYHPMRSGDAYFTLAMAYARLADFKEAKKWASIAFGTQPNFKEAARLLADLSAFEGNQLSQLRWSEISKECSNEGLSFQSKYIMRQNEQVEEGK